MFLDIRDVIKSLTGENGVFMGSSQSIGFHWLGLRQADYTKPCICVQETKDGIRAPLKTCSRCLATGYLFTDQLVKGYMWQGFLGVEFGAGSGKISTQQRNLIVKHDRPINKFDFILELDQDPDTGKIRQPFRIMRTFKVQDVFPVRGDDGRYEFWKCSIEERTADNGQSGEIGTGFQYGGNRSNGEPV